MSFWRDGIGRLTFDVPGVTSDDYLELCGEISKAFGLAPASVPVIGPDQMFWEFRYDDRSVGLDWDIWMEFMVVANSASAESLVRQIAEWIIANRQS